MPVKTEREYRSMPVMEIRAAAEEAEEAREEYIVEGYATTFNDPYVLFRVDGVDYKEQIDRHAFDNTDMSDVILQYDHEGRVYARQSNGTLQLSVDDHGLKVRANLGLTAGSRDLYEEIRSGLIKDMSFAFVVADDGDEYDEKEHLRTVKSIRKLYDTSVVSIPANPGTEISARSWCGGVAEREQQELLARADRERRARILRIKLEATNGNR